METMETVTRNTMEAMMEANEDAQMRKMCGAQMRKMSGAQMSARTHGPKCSEGLKHCCNSDAQKTLPMLFLFARAAGIFTV